MHTALENILTLLVNNTAELKSRFIWQQPMMRRFAALVYANAQKEADCDAIENCMSLIKQQTGIFSTFRGNILLALSALLSLNPAPDRLLSATMDIYGQLKRAGFHASDYLVLAAYQIARQVEPQQYGTVVSRTREFYESMKRQHWFLTGYDDYIFSAMLGISEMDARDVIMRMEYVYEQLKPLFFSRNGLQGLSQILVLFPDNDGLARLFALYDSLRNEGINFNRAELLPTLGALALLQDDPANIARQVADVCDALRHQKGFGVLSVQKMERILMGASVVAFGSLASGEQSALNAAIANSITNILIAQQAALAAAVASSAAASSSN